MKRPRTDPIIEALKEGISSLTISSSVSNKDLVCRDEHVQTITKFLEEDVNYTLQIFGMPGTGKTATVNYALAALSRKSRIKPSAVCLNGYVIQRSNDIYWTLFQHFTQTRWKKSTNCPVDQTAAMLDRKLRQKQAHPPLCVIIIDEADKMVEKHSKVLFKIIDWLSLPHANLKLITISNSMDLNMDSKTRSRLDVTKKLVFEPYRIHELKQILLRRISNITPKLFSDQAINLLCQQVSSQYGDIRRLLQTASSAVCVVLMNHSDASSEPCNICDGIVSLKELHGVIRQTFHDRSIEFLKSLTSPLLFLTLCIVAHETEKLFDRNEREFRVSSSRIYMRVQQHKRNNAQISCLHVLEKLDILRQVGIIDLSFGADRVPLSSIDSVIECPEEVLVSLLQPYQTIIDSCKLHDLWGSKIAVDVFKS